MRKGIVVALGQRRDVASEQALAGLLTQQSDAQLRLASAQGLAGRENALPVLAERLRVESNQNVRLELMRSVGLIRNPAAMDVLADVAQTKGEPVSRQTAIQELGRSFGASALPVLGRVLKHPDEAIRRSAVAAMARVRTDEVVAILQRTAETDASALVSGAAAAALASMQSAP
jgi:HEAT repeat protein